MSRLWVQIGAAAIFALAWTQVSLLEPKQESGVLPMDPPTPYIHYFSNGSPHARVLVIHGLDVSKEIMRTISAGLADAGFEVYSIDLPGHGDSAVPFHTDLAEQAIRNAKHYVGDNTIVLGHSLGAGLLLDLAATEQFSTMVLLAPPPIALNAIHADRVLIATGNLDIPRIRSFTPIAADIGEPHVESWLMPWSAHSAGIFNPAHIQRILEWLGGDVRKLRMWPRIIWLGLMFGAAVVFGVATMSGRKVEQMKVSSANVVATYVIGCAVALLLLKFFNPVSWLRLFATDYLVGFVLVLGLVTILFTGVGAGFSRRGVRKDASRPAPAKAGAYAFRAIVASAFVIVILGFVTGSHFLHMSLTNGRWWRFPFIAIASFSLFLSDELILRRLRPRWKSETIAILTRLILLAFILTGVLTFNRESGFLVLIAPLIVIFWLGLWFAAGLIHRHTQSPIAAALFAALVQGWAFAAWFVTI